MAADGLALEVQGKQAEAERTYAEGFRRAAPEYPEAIYRQALLAEQRKNVTEARKLLEQLRALPGKTNEFSAAAPH